MAVEALTRAGILADRFFLWIPGYIVHYEKIEPAVAVVVEPARGDGPGFCMDASFGGDVFERAVAAIAVQNVAAHAGHEEVGVSVVVVVGPGGAHAVAFAAHSCASGDLLEHAVAAVAIETVPPGGAVFYETGLGRSIGEEHVEQSVAIIIE